MNKFFLMMKLNQCLLRQFVIVLATAVLSISASNIFAGPAGPIAWSGQVSIGGGWGRMVHLTNGQWLCVTTAYPSGTNSYLQISRSTDSCRTWTPVSSVKQPGRTLDNGELIQLPNGIVLLTMRSLIPNYSYELPVYSSSNSGASWAYLSNIDTSSGTTAAAGHVWSIIPTKRTPDTIR
jgi:hypothetical protein